MAGRALRGIVGAPEKDVRFQETFLNGKVRFGDLRLRGASQWPLSGRQCRNFGAVDPHTEVDFLLAAGRGERLPEECASCGGKLEPPKVLLAEAKGKWVAVKARTRITGHTAVDPWTLRPRDGQLFQTSLLERDQTFFGDLWVADDVASSGRDFATEFSLSRLTLGRGGTRGQGHVKLDVYEAPAAGTDGLRARIGEMNRKWGRANEVVFSCTFLSPCLVLDEWLLSRSYPAISDLEEACGAPGGELAGYRLTTQFSQWTRIAGWNAQAGLPKSEVDAIAAGSSYLFIREVAEGENEAEMDRLAAMFARAERGVGERWEEGFGEAVFCHPYHLCRFGESLAEGMAL
jgi:hypothetical protein